MENWEIDFENAKIKFSKIDKQLNRHFTVMFYLFVLIISFIIFCKYMTIVIVFEINGK